LVLLPCFGIYTRLTGSALNGAAKTASQNLRAQIQRDAVLASNSP
jgi:hypothetical protein